MKVAPFCRLSVYRCGSYIWQCSKMLICGIELAFSLEFLVKTENFSNY